MHFFSTTVAEEPGNNPSPQTVPASYNNHPDNHQPVQFLTPRAVEEEHHHAPQIPTVDENHEVHNGQLGGIPESTPEYPCNNETDSTLVDWERALQRQKEMLCRTACHMDEQHQEQMWNCCQTCAATPCEPATCCGCEDIPCCDSCRGRQRTIMGQQSPVAPAVGQMKRGLRLMEAFHKRRGKMLDKIRPKTCVVDVDHGAHQQARRRYFWCQFCPNSTVLGTPDYQTQILTDRNFENALDLRPRFLVAWTNFEKVDLFRRPRRHVHCVLFRQMPCTFQLPINPKAFSGDGQNKRLGQ